MQEQDLKQEFLHIVLQNPYNAQILARLPELQVPDAMLVAGCLFQTVWNARDGRALTADIKDYDVFYCDPSDISWEAEDRVIRRAQTLFADLPVTVEVKNQARVHVWYEQKFGSPYPALQTSTQGIERFLIAGCCVGMTGDEANWQIEASYGLQQTFDGVLSINPRFPQAALFLEKARSYQQRWEFLRIEAC